MATLFELVFEQFLRISPQLIAKYTTVQDQLLYLILIPHVILFLFIWGFGMMIIREHLKLRYLVTLVAYIFMIAGGWYGSFFVPLAIGWFYIMLIFGLFLFFISKIFHPIQAQKLGQEVAPALGSSIGKMFTKQKDLDKLYREREHYEKQLNSLRGQTGPTVIVLRSQIEERLHQIDEKIRELGG